MDIETNGVIATLRNLQFQCSERGYDLLTLAIEHVLRAYLNGAYGCAHGHPHDKPHIKTCICGIGLK